MRVVITGIGAVTPIGNTVAEYWDALKKGVCGIDEITRYPLGDERFRLAAEIKNFDPAQVLDRAAGRKLDRFVQYALAATKEAYADSGLEGNIADEDLGVYYGTGIGGIETLCKEDKAQLEKGMNYVSPQFVPKMIANIAAGNIAIKYHAKGSCISVSTACATGTTAIGEAYRAIKDGYEKAVICGGSESAVTPLTVAGFGNCMALSESQDKNAASLPFDKRRGGFVLGEGAATLILEEYEHAKQRGAKIYAEVVGYGSYCDAHHVTAPDPEAVAITRCIKQAAKDLSDISAENLYINAHGTGTHLNDLTETKAFKNAFGDNAYKLHISSTKSMTAHMLGAAGAAEAIACLLALCEGIVPPTINLKEADPECDLNYTPNTAVHADIRAALSTSLGFGGHNACVAFKKL